MLAFRKKSGNVLMNLLTSHLTRYLMSLSWEKKLIEADGGQKL